MTGFKKSRVQRCWWLASWCVVGLAGAQPTDNSADPPAGWPAVTAANLAAALDNRPISLNFQSIDMKALLQVFADFSGLNLVPTDSVTGTVSVRLNDVPWQQALDIVLQSKGLVSRQEGRVLWVAPQGEWALREKKQLDAQAAL